MGLGYYLVDNLALNIEGVGYFVYHAHNSAGGGLDLLPRWHYLAQDNWSMYLDGGCGSIYTSDTLRDPGTHFNFTLQRGADATYNLTDRLAAMFGARWFHISDARIRGKNRNVGLDSPIFYVGVMSPFCQPPEVVVARSPFKLPASCRDRHPISWQSVQILAGRAGCRNIQFIDTA